MILCPFKNVKSYRYLANSQIGMQLADVKDQQKKRHEQIVGNIDRGSARKSDHPAKAADRTAAQEPEQSSMKTSEVQHDENVMQCAYVTLSSQRCSFEIMNLRCTQMALRCTHHFRVLTCRYAFLMRATALMTQIQCHLDGEVNPASAVAGNHALPFRFHN